MIASEHHSQTDLHGQTGQRGLKQSASGHLQAKPTAAEMSALSTQFNQGNLAQSEPLAVQMTQRFPQHGFGWKVLGAIYQQQGLLTQALDALKLAAELLPKDSEAHYNLANYYYDQHQLAEAVKNYQQAIKISPNFVQAHYNLGSVLKDQGLVAEAIVSYQKALKLKPKDAAMAFNLGLMCFENKKFADAVRYYEQGLLQKPNSVDALVILGASLNELREFRKAQAYFKKALKINAECVDAYNHLGLSLVALGDVKQAEKCYRDALHYAPESATAYNNLGALLKELGQLDEAEACYLKAIKLDPLRASAHNNLAVLYREQGKLAHSEACCQNAIKVKADDALAYNNLGLVLASMGRFIEAEAAYLKSIEYAPDLISTQSNLSITLNSMSRLTEAESYLKKVLEIAPNFINASINLCGNYLAQGRVQEAENLCLKAIKQEPNNLEVHNNLLFAMNYSKNFSPEECLKQAKKYGAVVAAQATPFTTWQCDLQAKRLRVGLVSGDLRKHAVAYFLENFVKHLDQTSIELFAYSTDAREDEVTARLKPYFTNWQSIVGLSDQHTAELIHQDGVHLLLDLSGHTSGNRLPILAWKPAPVQVSWLGYFATTGVAEVDYFIADEVGVPPGNQAHFVEKIKYLPDTRLCFTPPDVDVAVAPLPALSRGYITFGCFQNLAKVSDEVLDLWAEVMLAVPQAKLRWQCKSFRDEAIVGDLTQRFVARGVAANRLNLLGSVLRDAYLAAHAEIDMLLDTFPFNGGTTTCEALWMGVPTLTLAGNTLIARQGASLMSAAGLADWVAVSHDDYVNLAKLFSHNVEKLAQLRANLRAQVLASALFDAPRFAQYMQTALWEMWHESAAVKFKRHQENQQLSKQSLPLSNNDDQTASKQKLSVSVISATRYSEHEFWGKSALGLSLKRHLKQDARLSANVAFENRRGLSDIFNENIAQAEDDAILVFIHDDVWIDEVKFVDTVIAGLAKFDVIGVAGNHRRVANQPAWAFVDSQFTWDAPENLSGSIAHGQTAFGKAESFGATPASCELLDGVFLAAKKQSLIQKNVKFDTQFDFHLYDVDFCRAAKTAGLSLGTWLIKLTHQSAGNFGTRHWRAKYVQYLKKWQEPLANALLTTKFNKNTEADVALQQAMNEVLASAIQHQNAGELKEAEEIYLEILNVQPEHAEANHHLGVIEAHTKGAEVSVARLEKAVQAQPENEQFWVRYIDALMQAGATEAVTEALALGQQYGLRAETAQMLAAEFDVVTSEKDKLNQVNVEPERQKEHIAQWHHKPTNQKSSQATESEIPEAWLAAYPQSLMIEYTSRCNLRCKYCPKSNPGEDQVPGRNMDMTSQTIDAVIDLIRQHPYKELLLAGTGESTFHPNWLEDFPSMIAAGKASNPTCHVHVNSNFAMKYEDVHWAVFAQLDGIVISIDTADRQLTKEVRAKSDLGLIIYNIVRFKTFCETRNLKLPRITVNVTLYQEAAAGLTELMVLLSNLPVSAVSISDLYEGEAANCNDIHSINAKDPAAFKQTLVHIQQATQKAQSLAKFNLSIQPHLIERIQSELAVLEGHQVVETANINQASEKSGQTTKMCLQPWTRFTLAADAAIFPCCVTNMAPVGRIDTHLQEDGLDGHKIRDFRQRLLTGDVPTICQGCTNAASCSTESLQQAVAQLAQTSALADTSDVANESKVASELSVAVDEVFNLAIQHQQVGETEQAMMLYKEVLNINKHHAEANHHLAVLEVGSSDILSALARFEIAVQIQPENQQYWVSYIDALMLSGNVEAAIDAIEKGQKYGLTPEMANMLATEFAQKMEAEQVKTTLNNAPMAESNSKEAIVNMVRDAIAINVEDIQHNIAQREKGSVEITPFVNLSVFEGEINQLMAAGQQNEILDLIYQSASAIKLQEELVGNKIFMPYFDMVLEDIHLGVVNVKPRSGKQANIVIASELYHFGGHTKVVKDILESVENPILIITDVFNRVAQQDLKSIVSTVQCPIFVLPNESYLDKAKRLAAFINGYAKNVFLLSHHEDVVAIAGCQKNLDSNFYFIHHADHHPALGNHVDHFKHVDLFEARSRLCGEDLHTSAIYLPTTSEDQGAKVFQYPTAYSTITAGSAGKFAITGALSLSNIVVQSVKTTGAQHYHFGDLHAKHVELIRASLEVAFLNPDSFIYMGNVASLWQHLLAIDAHIYIGSAPLMGAKADIEAQGAAYPLLAYKDPQGPRHLNVGSHNPQTIHWSTIDEFISGLSAIMQQHAMYSKASREFYLSHCAKAAFKNALDLLSQ